MRGVWFSPNRVRDSVQMSGIDARDFNLVWGEAQLRLLSIRHMGTPALAKGFVVA